MSMLIDRPGTRSFPTMPAEGDWFGLYPKGRSKDRLYTPESTRHPAKMSLPLVRQILCELLTYGWLKDGDVVADPFGGRGTTAIEWCSLHPENRAITCELEQPFIDMSYANRKQAEQVLGRQLHWDIFKGDSRAFDTYVERAALHAAITSPPYGKGVIGSTGEKGKERLRRLTQDPTSSLYGRDPNGEWFKAMTDGYHWSPGNIDLAPINDDFAALEDGGFIDLDKYVADTIAADAAIGSPPYEDSLCSDDPAKRGGLFRDPKRAGDPSLTRNYNGSYTIDSVISSPPYNQAASGGGIIASGLNADGSRRGGEFRREDYGNTQGQIGNSYDPADDYEGLGKYTAIASPPFEAQSGGNPEIKEGPLADPRLHARHAASRIGKNGGYGENKEGQIGNAKGATYASLCRDVYRALYAAEIPHVVLVTKNPVKNQQLKPLDLLTIKLMDDAGYDLVARRRAYLWQTVAELREWGVVIERPSAPKGKLDQMFWDKWDERPYGELSFFNIIHMQQGRMAPAKWEDVLFFKRR